MKTKNLQKIYESNKTTIYKGKYDSFTNDVIIKVLNAEYPSEEQITRFYNEYDFTKDIEIYGVRKVLKKEKKDGKNILILEYFEGEKISNYLSSKKNTIEELLQIAQNVAQTLGEIHQQNIIHKDINANNILMNNKNEICIIDFGLATKYTLKTQNLTNPEHLVGTLHYISPEQTGRMNRSVDERTDLYSLGIVLYQIFTGELPFKEKDNMELIHSHIAKIPIPPNDINKNIPKILSDIILKLLAKNAEDRYQSAFGLKHDLNRVLKDLQASLDLESSFKLGEKDFSGKLSIPEKLYGREKETKKLYKIYENVCNGKTELLLISGHAGVGKSSLIHEIHKPLTETKGFYIEGKFDQFQKNIPYHAIIQAFTEFVNIILKESEENLNYWKNLIQKAVGEIGKVLINIIPDLELIIGKQPKLPELDGKEAQNRFNYVWSSFIKAISQAEHPLVIFIDDLQWADNSSIELLKILLSDPDIKYLLCIIAYRDNEININDLRQLGMSDCSKIKLDNLKLIDVNYLINDTLNIKKVHYTEILSDLVFSKTSGNAFFTIQFLKNLYENEFLKYYYKENFWKWNFEKIKTQNFTDNVIELMANKIKKLPKATQSILRIAACVGNRFDLKILSIIYKKDEDICKKDLEPAILETFILPLDTTNSHAPLFKFVHDRIQQAVYSTIPNNEKNNFHLQTGRLLLAFLNKENLQKQIFEVVNQFNLGKDIIENEKEKKILAELNLQATIKAKSASAYIPAKNYAKMALSFLDENSWQTDYSYTLKIHNELVELSYLTGNYEDTDKYASILIENSKNVLDKTNAYYILITSYRAKSHFKEAIRTGKKILSELGINYPKKTNKLHTIVYLLKTIISLKRLGLNKFRKLPLIEDKHIAAQLKLADAIGTSIFNVDKALLPLVVLKGLNIIIKAGHSESSPYYISAYGLVLSMINKLDKAYELGKISEEIQDKYNFQNIKCRTNYVNLSLIKIWHENINNLAIEFYNSYKIGLNTGDYEFASYNLYYSAYFSMYGNKNLNSLKKSSIENLKQIIKFNQGIATVRYLFFLELLENLTNKDYENVFKFSGKYFKENIEIPILIGKEDFASLGIFYQTKLLVLYIFDIKEKMDEALEQFPQYLISIKGYYFYALTNFYSSLCSLATIENKNKKQRKAILHKIYRNQKQMKVWAKHCPDNFQNKYDLVQAEISRIEGKHSLAENLYISAIKSANESQLLNEEAISWEAGGRYYLQKNNMVFAKNYMQNAYKKYKNWGAIAKLKQLEKKYPQFLFEKQKFISSIEDTDTTIKSSTSTIVAGASHFDLTSIVKASQSLSGIVNLESLLKSMLEIIMENAGAEYAVIIQKENKIYSIEAKGRHISKNTEVLQSENIENSDEIALNIVKYVIRTKKLLVIDNALTNKEYLSNNYIQQNKVKSVFCFPVIHKNKLTAVLYLENNLSTHVFNKKRVETINILSSQIAVSIENALLYKNLEEKVKGRTEELNQTNEELQSNIELVQDQKDEIEKQKNKVEEVHKDITDSINYAKRIQVAILPTAELFSKHFSDYFILFKPRDIVSGDFYWAKEINEYFIFAAADCTGHGVPGAFVSMLGISFLNEIVRRKEINKANQILEALRNELKISLHQKGTIAEQKDGMDIAVCVINTNTNLLQYAGAYNPLHIIRNEKRIIENGKLKIENERLKTLNSLIPQLTNSLHPKLTNTPNLITIKADRQPIGIYIQEKPFTNHEFQLQQNDSLYLLTDGYVDQFGGKNNHKFYSKRFKKLLLSIQNKNMQEQKQILEQNFVDWQGNNRQLDDILVMGVKI